MIRRTRSEIAKYYATDLEYVGQNLDELEEVEVTQMSFSALEQMALDNTMTDAKSIALLYRLKHYLGR